MFPRRYFGGRFFPSRYFPQSQGIATSALPDAIVTSTVLLNQNHTTEQRLATRTTQNFLNQNTTELQS